MAATAAEVSSMEIERDLSFLTSVPSVNESNKSLGMTRFPLSSGLVEGERFIVGFLASRFHGFFDFAFGVGFLVADEGGLGLGDLFGGEKGLWGWIVDFVGESKSMFGHGSSVRNNCLGE